VVCSTVAAGNDYSKQKQFQKLKEISGAKKQVSSLQPSFINLTSRRLISGGMEL